MIDFSYLSRPEQPKKEKVNEFIFECCKQTFKNKESFCPICGKKFYVNSGKYLYKKSNKNGYTRWACSYTCYNKLCDAIDHSVKR